jgi:hypothetical protein
MNDVIVPKSDKVIEGPSPWDRKNGEPKDAYLWFLEYVYLGVMRSIFKLSNVKDLPYGMKEKPTQYQLKQWRMKWNWDDRANDYDDELTANALGAYETKMEQMRLAVKSEEMQYAAKITALADKIVSYVLEGNIPVKTTTKTQSDTVDELDQKVRTTKTVSIDYQSLALRVPAMYITASDLLRRALNMTKEKNELVVNEDFEQLDLGEVDTDELKQLERQITEAIGASKEKHIA